jgi:hypothetical protein
MQIREDMAAAQRHAWARIGQPGTWLTAAERVAAAAETRHARACPLCAERRHALSPALVGGDHATLGRLPAAEIEAIHRIATDSGRIGEAWFRRLGASGLADERYVELLSIAAVTTCIDTFRRAAGLAELALPTPAPGAPSQRRPRRLTDGIAWVPVLLPEDRGPEDPDLYLEAIVPQPRARAHIYFALSLVPDAMTHWWDLLEPMYLTAPQMGDYLTRHRAIDRAQIEMLASRVAALNQCMY